MEPNDGLFSIDCWRQVNLPIRAFMFYCSFGGCQYLGWEQYSNVPASSTATWRPLEPCGIVQDNGGSISPTSFTPDNSNHARRLAGSAVVSGDTLTLAPPPGTAVSRQRGNADLRVQQRSNSRLNASRNLMVV
jgi:hypothetical protein